jgi:hypothetical protein
MFAAVCAALVIIVAVAVAIRLRHVRPIGQEAAAA